MLSSLLATTATYYEGWETVCPVSAPFFGFMGIASAVIFANLVSFFFFRKIPLQEYKKKHVTHPH